jgi:hypothetical protein
MLSFGLLLPQRIYIPIFPVKIQEKNSLWEVIRGSLLSFVGYTVFFHHIGSVEITRRVDATLIAKILLFVYYILSIFVGYAHCFSNSDESGKRTGQLLLMNIFPIGWYFLTFIVYIVYEWFYVYIGFSHKCIMVFDLSVLTAVIILQVAYLCGYQKEKQSKR